jgi:hypothetical protein
MPRSFVMKKWGVIAVLLTLVATSASAEHTLLVTDVPAPGQFEARLDVSYWSLTGRKPMEIDAVNGEAVRDSDKVKDKGTGAVATVGVGVARGLKLSASLPYTFSQHEEGIRKDGFGDITLGARFVPTRLVKLPVDLAVGIDWKTTSGEKDTGTGRNDYAPYLALSRNLHPVIPYMKYQPHFIAKESGSQTIHQITAGAEIEFSNRYSLDAAVHVFANGRHEDETFGRVKSSNDVEIELVPYINLTRNLYLLPKFAYRFISDRSMDRGWRILRDADEYTIGLGCYYLF